MGRTDPSRDLAGLRYLGKFGVRECQEKMKDGKVEIMGWVAETSPQARRTSRGDRVHSTEEPKELRPGRQLEEKAKLEKAGETAAVLDLKGNKWAYPPSASGAEKMHSALIINSHFAEETPLRTDQLLLGWEKL